MNIVPHPNHPRFKALIFDWGDVMSKPLVESLLPEACRRWHVDRETLIRAYISAAQPYERGDITRQGFVRLFLSGLGSRETPDEEEVMAFPVRAWSVPEPAMIELVRALKGPYRTALLSNNIPEVVAAIRHKVRLEELFDEVVLSYEERVRKPDAPIYVRCLDKLGVPAERAVFIDNHASMVLGAEAVGLTGLRFSSVEELVRDLARLDIVRIGRG